MNRFSGVRAFGLVALCLGLAGGIVVNGRPALADAAALPQKQESVGAGSSPAAAGVCFEIDRVVVEGAVLIKPVQLAKASAPFEHRCIGGAEINDLLKAITDIYLSKGYITSRVYVPPQDLKKSRTLRLVAIEGVLEDIYVNGKPPERRGEIATAFPGMKGRKLNLRDMETGLDQMNRLRSNNAKTNLLPGSVDGASILNIVNVPNRPIFGRVTHNNYGADSTGHARTMVNVNGESLLHLNELVSLTYEHSGPDYPGHKDGHGRGTLYSGNVSIPFGYFTGSIFGSHYHYKSKVPTRHHDAETKGRSREVGASVAWLLHRDQISKTTVSVTASYKDSDNYLMGSRLESGRRKHLTGGLAINHTRQMWDGMWTFQLGYEPGTDMMDAPAVVDPDAPDLGFSKFTGQVSVFRPFKIGTAPFDFSGILSFQHAPSGLVGAQQMSIGGFGTVRGLREGVLYGNTGAFGRSEVIYRGLSLQGKPISKFIAEIQPYAAFDWGWVRREHKYAIDGGSLMGGTVGVRSGDGIIDLDMGYSRILKTDAYVRDRDLFFLAVTTTF